MAINVTYYSEEFQNFFSIFGEILAFVNSWALKTELMWSMDFFLFWENINKLNWFLNWQVEIWNYSFQRAVYIIAHSTWRHYDYYTVHAKITGFFLAVFSIKTLESQKQKIETKPSKMNASKAGLADLILVTKITDWSLQNACANTWLLKKWCRIGPLDDWQWSYMQ